MPGSGQICGGSVKTPPCLRSCQDDRHVSREVVPAVSRQAGAGHRRDRREADLQAARRAQHPPRPSSARGGAAARRRRRDGVRQPPRELRGLLGLPAQRALRHRRQPQPLRGRGGVHRRGLRRERPGRLRRQACARRGSRRSRRPAAPAGLRRAGAGLRVYDDALAAASPESLPEQPHGDDFLYSSGTTGRPKGVKVALPGSRWTSRATPTSGSSGPSTASTPRPSTSPRRRSTTRHRCASAASCTPSAAPW